ncbi:hypothetical protein AYB34_08850 [Leptospira sp. ZV016]|nr:hypothetical protein AYB32_08255 [Leptospira kirschneri]KXZ34069.1 hypothetical protein AYB34_08850 [Leptospira sp. ZV016]
MKQTRDRSTDLSPNKKRDVFIIPILQKCMRSIHLKQIEFDTSMYKNQFFITQSNRKNFIVAIHKTASIAVSIQ